MLSAGDFTEIDSEYLERLYGGDFMTGLKNVYSKAQSLKPYAKKAVRLGKDLKPVVNTIAPRAGPAYEKGLDFVSELLGMGYTKKQIKEMEKSGYTKKDYKNLLAGA